MSKPTKNLHVLCDVQQIFGTIAATYRLLFLSRISTGKNGRSSIGIWTFGIGVTEVPKNWSRLPRANFINEEYRGVKSEHARLLVSRHAVLG